jgi:hypothetical protein
MKIKKEIEVQVGEDGLVVFREPTNEEWNAFTAERYPVGRHARMKDNSAEARAKLFDKLAVRFDKLEDEIGPIAVEDKARIPMRLKASLIFTAFEQDDIDVKN